MSDEKKKTKKPYRRPKLTDYGDLAEITKMAGASSSKHGSRSDPGGLARTRL